jgi:HSP20 family molecular chaperone IbpA
MTDDIDDIFDMMDRVFGRTPRHSYTRQKHISPDNYERLMDDDNLYYTFELRQFDKDDVGVEYIKSKSSMDTHGTIKIVLNDDTYSPMNLRLPYPIEDDKMKVTFRNGILDIMCPLDKESMKKLEID